MSKKLQYASSMNLFLNTAHRANPQRTDLNAPTILLSTNLFPEVEYDAVKLSIVDLTLNKDVSPTRFKRKNTLFMQRIQVQTPTTFEIIPLAIPTNRSFEWTEIADFLTAELTNITSTDEESIVCTYNELTDRFSFEATCAAGHVPMNFYRFDLTNTNSVHQLFGMRTSDYPDGLTEAFTAILPVPTTMPFPIVQNGNVFTPKNVCEGIYEATYFLNCNLNSTNIDCIAVDNIQKSTILMRIIDENIPAGFAINCVAAYKEMWETLVHTRGLPPNITFWITQDDGTLAVFESDWNMTVRFEFLKYV